MKEKIKYILAGLLIGIIALPVVALSGSFVSSLIAGKTPEEAVEILATQIDFLIGRVEIVETKQAGQEQSISGLQATTTQQEQTISELQTTINKQNKEILCQQLIKQTPQKGGFSFMNIDIVKFYQAHQSAISEQEARISRLQPAPLYKMGSDNESSVKYYDPDIYFDPQKGDRPLYSMKDQQANLNYLKEVLSEAQPLYQNYIVTCGD